MDLDRYLDLRNTLLHWKSLLAENLRRKAEASPQALQRLRTLFDQEGSSDSFINWLNLWCRQATIQWILRILFLRVLEDRGLLGATRIRSGDGQKMWGQIVRNLGAASYVLWCCRDAAHLLPDLFGPSGFDFLLPDDDVMQRFLDEVWRRPDSNREGWLRFDFRSDPDQADEGFQTRFIGDLYQELDSEIRERHALMQTPHFITQFILQHTLIKRFEEKDFRTVTMIDPTCGSGHFLVDGFWLFVRQYEQTLGGDDEQLKTQERVQIARRIIEEHIFGCDINPYATALSRFRLLLAACDYARPASLQDLRDLHIHVVTVDSLIPYERFMKDGAWGGGKTAKILGNIEEIRVALPVLQRRYDVVVGNPPYIVPRDKNRKKIYLKNFPLSASGKFHMGAPFTERFFQLACADGKVGFINSNAFTKRDFGQTLIEVFLPKISLEAIVDLDGIKIPNHGTPTLILFGVQAPRSHSDLKIVTSKLKSGELTDEAQSALWENIVHNYSLDEYSDGNLIITHRPIAQFEKHPWNFDFDKIELLKKISLSSVALKNLAIDDGIGISLFTLLDEIFVQPVDFLRRLGIPADHFRPIVLGEDVRDWEKPSEMYVLFPYTVMKQTTTPVNVSNVKGLFDFLKPFKSLLSESHTAENKSKETGWYEFGRFTADKYLGNNRIAFTAIATHNHFIVDTSTNFNILFKQSAPLVKLTDDSLNANLLILGLLNTPLPCLHLKQRCYNKGASSDPVRDRFDLSALSIETIPIAHSWSNTKLLNFCNEMFECIQNLEHIQTKLMFYQSGEAYQAWNASLIGYVLPHTNLSLPFTDANELHTIRQQYIAIRQSIHNRMIFLQEEMDWLAYEMYGLISKAPLADDYLSEVEYKTARLELGQRSFELAGKGYQGDWLSGYQPASLPEFLHPLTEARMSIIQSNPDIALLEAPLYKRRWIPSDYEQEFQEAAAWWLAEKLEYALEQHGKPISLREWARLLSTDARVNAVLEVLTGSPAFDLEGELLKVITANAVSNRPEHIFKLSGLRKYLNRPKNGESLPPEFESKDFNDPVAWRLRGKLNIPRERFIAYREFDHTWRGENIPESGGPWYGWAGWDSLQRADALVALLGRANRAGWEVNFRQCGLRAALRDLLPQIQELSSADRMEFEAIATGCGLGLDMPCYCQAFKEAFKHGEPLAPGLNADILDVKLIEVESERPRHSKRKGPAKPNQLELDL